MQMNTPSDTQMSASDKPQQLNEADKLVQMFGAMTVAPDNGARAVYSAMEDRGLALRMPMATPAQQRTALTLRYGKAPLDWMLAHDCSFLLRNPDLSAATPEAERLERFARFVEQFAMMDARVPQLALAVPRTQSGAELLVQHVIGISATGWMALVGRVTATAQPALYTAHYRTINPQAAGADGQIECRWQRYTPPDDMLAAELGRLLSGRFLSAIHGSRVALFSLDTSIAMVHDATWPADKLPLSVRVETALPAVAVQLAASEHALALVYDTGELHVVGYEPLRRVVFQNFEVLPATPTVAAPPLDRLTGQPLPQFAGLGSVTGAPETRIKDVHLAQSVSFDDADPTLLLAGTDRGCVVLLDVLSADGASIINIMQVGESPEVEHARGKSYKHPGLGPVRAARGMCCRADGWLAAIMDHSFSIRCIGAELAQQAGVTIRIPRYQERDCLAHVDISIGGTAILAHTMAGNNLNIGSLCPTKGGNLTRFQIGLRNEDGTALPSGTRHYNSICALLGGTIVLLPNGCCAMVEPLDAQAHASYVKARLAEQAPSKEQVQAQPRAQPPADVPMATTQSAPSLSAAASAAQQQ